MLEKCCYLYRQYILSSVMGWSFVLTILNERALLFDIQVQLPLWVLILFQFECEITLKSVPETNQY